MDGRQQGQAGTLVVTDHHGRTVLPGHPERTFVVCENSDGSVLLSPVQPSSDAQAEYDTNGELRGLLARAMVSRTVRRHR